MFPKLITAVFVLAFAPGFALAAGCSHGSAQTQSCAGGTTFDTATATCVPVVSG